MAQRIGSRLHLLLIDDNADLRQVLATTLKVKGYMVECAEGGKQALAMMRRSGGRPHLVITDLQMPDGDGWTLRQNMLADEELVSVPVVVMSAANGSKEALNASAYLEKPVKLDSLLSVIEEYAG